MMHIDFAETYLKARNKLKLAEILLEINSDTDCEENLKRSRKRSACVARNSSDEEDNTMDIVKEPVFQQIPLKVENESNETQG